MFKIFFLISFIFVGCKNPDPVSTVRKSVSLWDKGKKKKSCEVIKELSPRYVENWSDDTAFSYLRMLSMCLYESGGDTRTYRARLSEPWKSYFTALSQFGSGKDINKSVVILQKIIKKYPEKKEFVYRLGLLYMLDERFSVACPLLESVHKKGGDIRFTLSLARCYLGNGKIKSIHTLLSSIVREGVTLKQISMGRKIMNGARSYKNLFNREMLEAVTSARKALKSENAGIALDKLDKVARKYPGYPAIHYLMAVIHLRLGNRPDAAVELGRALRIDPVDSDSHMLLGIIFKQSMQFNKAEKHLKTAISYNPFNLRAHAVLRDIFEKRGKFMQAASEQRKIVYLHGENATSDLKMTLAAYLEKSNNLDEAIKENLGILKKLGDEAGYVSLVALARIYLNLSAEKPENAVSYRKKARGFADRAYAVRPTDSEVYAIRVQLGAEKKPQSDFEKKIKISGARKLDEKNEYFH
ncbi:MAG: tetratricopeptide repeat protein [Deltaproteobacteria bacterium]|nr:tetratricopeptide repeat protein [Deltaproteobacteria bacterium]